MKIALFLIVGILVIWPTVCWFSYIMTGWSRLEKKLARKVTNDMYLATSVAFKKFGNYNRCVHVGVEDYGVSFKPGLFLLFHSSFSIPWVQILSYELKPGKLTTLCILHTNVGKISITGDVAEIVARGCAGHYVNRSV